MCNPIIVSCFEFGECYLLDQSMAITIDTIPTQIMWPIKENVGKIAQIIEIKTQIIVRYFPDGRTGVAFNTVRPRINISTIRIECGSFSKCHPMKRFAVNPRSPPKIVKSAV